MSDYRRREPMQIQAVRTWRPRCVHHWILQDQSEGWVRGQCRSCNLKRRFPAAPESTQRFDDYRELTAATAYGERLAA
ncbi:MAG: hypothetical protein EXR66_00485 [Dehalococcoidia bacterium]|nr:hypothetical protein [Dehalococcoidia bacterium]